VEVVEDDETAERLGEVEPAADRRREDGVGGELLQGDDVRTVGHLTREPLVPPPVPCDVEQLDAGKRATGDLDVAERGRDRLPLRFFEPRERVRRGARDQPDAHDPDATAVCEAGAGGERRA
jgi:hypothetical protein